MNRSPNTTTRKRNPVQDASFMSKRLFLYLVDLFRIGRNRSIEDSDIYETLPEHKSEGLSDKFHKLWTEELKRKSPSLLRMYTRAYGWSVIGLGFLFCIIETTTRIAQPLCLGGLVTYFSPGETTVTKSEAYMYAVGIILSSLIPVCIFHPFILFIFQQGMKIRVATCTLMYEKVMRLSKCTTFDGLNGQVINLMSNDVGRYDVAMAFLHDLWKGPLEALLLGYFIYREIGVSGILGMAFLLGFIPLQAYIGRKAATYRLRTAKRTDIRIRFMNEIIQGIQVIKMYAWEKSFAAMVDKVRRKEINAIRGSFYVRATFYCFILISKFSLFISLMSYIYFGNIFTARKVFIVSSFYNVLNESMVHFWPLAITTCAEAYISIKRINEFLLRSETKEKALENEDHGGDAIVANGKTEKEITDNVKRKMLMLRKTMNVNGKSDGEHLLPPRIDNETAEHKGVILKNVTALWNSDGSRNGLNSVDLEVKEGRMCAVIGPVGSGKTTLLQVIIGELELDEGTIEVNGRVSYAAQEPWLFEGSIRRNIIFVEEYDEARYHEVIKVCALQRDLDMFPHGDATIVGERGVSLSGGQKARVSLARAIYRRADIYLLDDPLSAVDTQVGKHIFERCIRRFLADKVVILVTHQLQYLKDIRQIVLLNGGRIEMQGSYDEIRQSNLESILSLAPDESQEPQTPVAEQKLKTFPSQVDFKGQDDSLVEEEKETQAIGSVSLNVYKSYFKAIENTCFIVFVFVVFILSQFAISGTDYFVAQWVNWEESLVLDQANNTDLIASNFVINTTTTLPNLLEENSTDEVLIEPISTEEDSQRQFFMIIYGCLMLTLLYLVIQRTFAFFKLCLMASTKLHDRLFRGITRATMWFFNNNPSGRILNRFSKDIGGIDSQLPNNLIDCINFFLEVAAVMVVVGIVNFWMIIPTIVMSILLYAIRWIYINTGRSIKRLESMTRSPIFSHVNATLQGLSTIRALKAQKYLLSEFHLHQNVNSSAWYMYISTARSFAMWLDLICCIYIAIVTLSFLFLDNQTLGGNVGLAIMQVNSLIGMCQWGMRQTAELENMMTSVERVLEYADLPSEAALETEAKHRPFKGWPNQGALSFNNLSLRYSATSEVVLKDMNFSIRAGEKIGIVGRTGAGKSSIIQALFRLAPIEGKIEIDGIDTQTLGLHDLRSKISIIPQDPILFSGSLRANLDPFDERKDAEIWSALEGVELKEVVTSLAGAIDCRMADGGSNFSMGQRQLACLARAILRDNRILVLDEATANVDPETDRLIQTTIRTRFAHCTVLTIAHRLHTVMDSDRVLVMDAGRVVEFGAPHELLQRSGGHLKALVDQTGPATATLLAQIAEETFNRAEQKKNK